MKNIKKTKNVLLQQITITSLIQRATNAVTATNAVLLRLINITFLKLIMRDKKTVEQLLL